MPAPHYQTFDKLRRIWSPEDFRKLQEHAAKFEGLPPLPIPLGALMPEHDGDMAQLEELADAILGAAPDAPKAPVVPIAGLIERAARAATARIHNVPESEIAETVSGGYA